MYATLLRIRSITPFQWATLAYALVIAVLTYLVGLWGSTHQPLLAEPSSLHGIGWITVPMARFLMETTHNGEGFYLILIAGIMGGIVFCLGVALNASYFARRR